jgi:hypothetical protein
VQACTNERLSSSASSGGRSREGNVVGYRTFFAQEKAVPATKDVSDAFSQFTYRGAPSYLMDKDLLDDKGNSNYSSASL